ncbi:MAG: hypothetical protein PHY29_07485 [Syntrophales bacterium]|nr:hypothetical protein [Syntrophales bacterium]
MEEKKGTFTISGSIKIEDKMQDKDKVVMGVFARIGRRTIASCLVSKNGKFTIKFERKQKLAPAMMELVIGPPINEGRLTRVNTKQISISSKEWKVDGNKFSIEKQVEVAQDLVICWLPRDIKICGVVCKDIVIEGSDETRCCPVPYAKVEIYDVDSLLFTLDSLHKNQVAEEVTKMPIKNTVDISKLAFVGTMKNKPAPSVPKSGDSNKAIYFEHDFGHIEIIKQYEHIPLYSKHLLGEAYTDQCGEFCLTFTWFPGCFHPDINPDLLFKVSQTFDGGFGPVTNTIYSEGYSDTRWDISDYHWVKLDVDKDVFVACNPDCHPLLDRRALFLGVGNQEIYNHIEQGDDPSRACGFVYNGSFLKSPFGGILDIKGAFGSKVEEMGERWYRMSYAKINSCNSKPENSDPTAWTSIKDALTDTKYYWDAGAGMLHYESVALGPHSLTSHPDVEFYQIRNTQDENGNDLYWQNQNIILQWMTVQLSSGEWQGKIDDGLYVLKIEVFDESGNPASDVIIGDDGGNFAHMFMQINNKTPIVDIKEVYNGGSLISMECGSFEHSIGEQVKFLVDAYHPDNHLRYWYMSYQIGYGANNGVVDKLSDGTYWSDSILEDFRGKEDEFVIWGDFDNNLGLTSDPPSTCSTFGISIQLSACTKTTNGYVFLGSTYGHYKETHAGLAVHHNQAGG